ncbi:hypothetical protein [Salinarimonas rosea]|uniref:hypothetical protein n=1 Tax=Salinarimonas rosea TaxID=552063 RepID=UPI0005B95C7B|nr:hypothetical protein [Salinarimonas rosea]
MRRDEFKAWLEMSGRAPSATRIRISYVSAIERRMQALGSPFADIDAAYETDKLEQLRSALADLTKELSGRRHGLSGLDAEL